MQLIQSPRFHRNTITTAVSLACALLVQHTMPVMAAESGAAAHRLEEVLVTAQKREQAAIDVPFSVTAVSAERLSQGNLVRLADYAAQVPGMSVTALSRGYSSVVLRGISTGISQGTPSTAFYIDEAPIGSINAYATGSTLTPDLDPADLRRIEVLKGPQGTLYGAGAVGGLLRYVTVRPDSESFSGAVTLGGDTVNEGGEGYVARIALNVPLVADTAALRISGFDREEAGYIDNPVYDKSDVNKANTQGGRIALGWDLADNWSLQLWGLTQRFDTGGIGAQNVNTPELKPVGDELERGVFVPEKQKIQLDALNATINGQFGNFELVSSTTYQTVEAETHVDQSTLFGPLFALAFGLPNLGGETIQMIDTERWSQELRLRSDAFDKALEYEVGLFYTKEKSSNSLPPTDPFVTTSLAPFPLGIPIADALIKTEYEEYSLFGNATYAVTSQFELMAGVRISRDNQDYLQDYKLSVLSPTPTLIVQDVSNEKTAYMLSARYKPSEDTAVYARVATGYRPGGPSALPPGIVPGGKQSFDPDTLTSYELGYKAVLLDGRLSLESALFTTDWEDIQIQTSTQTAAGTYQYFVNGGSATSRGAELTVTYLPIDQLTLRATAAYTDATLSEEVAAVGGLDGDRLPFVPERTGSLAADYRFTVGGAEAWLGASINYIGERKSSFSQQFKYFDVSSYTTYNLNAGIELGPVSVNLYGKNLSDERGVNFMNNVGFQFPGLNPLGNPYAQGVIQPRTIGAELTYRF